MLRQPHFQYTIYTKSIKAPIVVSIIHKDNYKQKYYCYYNIYTEREEREEREREREREERERGERGRRERERERRERERE